MRDGSCFGGAMASSPRTSRSELAPCDKCGLFASYDMCRLFACLLAAPRGSGRAVPVASKGAAQAEWKAVLLCSRQSALAS